MAASATQRRPAGPAFGAAGFRRHSLYVELLGAAGLWSANYEYQFRPDASARLGFGSWEIHTWTGSVEAVVVPVMVSYLIQIGRLARSEFGLGVGVGEVRVRNTEVDDPDCFMFSCGAKPAAAQDRSHTQRLYLTATAGLRVGSASGAQWFRVGLTPLLGFGDVFFIPWLGLSLGLAW